VRRKGLGCGKKKKTTTGVLFTVRETLLKWKLSTTVPVLVERRCVSERSIVE